MILREVLKNTEKFVTDNSPSILAAIGVTGTVTTAYLTGKATVKATRILDKAEGESDEDLDRKAKAKLVWKLYIPAVGTGAFTIAAIITSNRIGTRRAAAVAAAFSASERAWEEYKDKVIEKIGDKKAQEVRDEVAQDRVNRNPVSGQQVIVTGGGDVLCHDEHTGRYFTSDMETLKKAQNDVNYEVINHGYASLTDFYNRVGLSRTKTSDDVGWNSDKLLELIFSTTMSDDERPCISVDFAVAPARDFFRVH